MEMKGWISPGTNKLVSPSLFHSLVAVAAVGLKLQEHHFSTRLDLKRTRRQCFRGILVKLVIRVSSGHQKIKIISFVKYATFA